MESIYYIKSIGQPQTIQSSKGETLAKLTIVISTKEVRTGENGPYTIDHDFVVDLLGERASSFNFPVGSWIVGSLSFTAREYDGRWYQEIRLNRYTKL